MTKYTALRRLFLYLIPAIYTVTISTIPAPGSYDDYDSVVDDIQRQVGCSPEDARAIFLIVNDFADKIQRSFTYVASSRDTISRKQAVIAEIIQRYFESESSIIQVSSVTDHTVYDYTIKVYLDRLARLQQIYGYVEVRLEFRPDYLGIGRVERIDSSSFELSISMWQYFYGRSDSVTYSDDTRKKFRLRFSLINGRVHVKISEIHVAETLPRR